MRGLKDALLLMPEGARWRVYVPAKMGFLGNVMLRQKDLIYEIDLVSIDTPPPRAVAPAAPRATVQPPGAAQPSK